MLTVKDVNKQYQQRLVIVSIVFNITSYTNRSLTKFEQKAKAWIYFLIINKTFIPVSKLLILIIKYKVVK